MIDKVVRMYYYEREITIVDPDLKTYTQGVTGSNPVSPTIHNSEAKTDTIQDSFRTICLASF